MWGFGIWRVNCQIKNHQIENRQILVQCIYMYMRNTLGI